MAQLSIYDKQRHHSKKDFTCSIGAHNYIYITFRHDSWKRFTSSEHILVARTESGAFKFGDPLKVNDIGTAFKLKTDKKGDPQTSKHTRYLQIDGVKYPGFFEIAQRTAGSYDFPKEEAKPEKNEATEYLKKIYAESNQKAEPAPMGLGELLQIAINNAVATAFEAYLPDTFKEVLQKQFEEEYRRGRIKGFEEGKAYAEKPTPACTENPDKWAI